MVVRAQGAGRTSPAGALPGAAGPPEIGRLAASCLALLFFSVLIALPLSAEEMGEFSFELLPDGTPRFTQVLRWEADPNVLYYEVTMQTAAGEAVSVSRVDEPVLEFNLGPGDYRYRIVLYNLLGKPELSLPWRFFTVRKAEIPRVASLSQKVWFVEELQPQPQLTLQGEALVPGATVVLKPADSSAPAIAGSVVEQGGTSSVRVEFPERRIIAGEYSLVFTNPSGLSFTVPRALLVRYQRPLDLLLCGGYAPWIALYDSWYRNVWSGTFFPVSAMGRLSAYFVKRPYGYFGAELTVKGQLAQGGTETTTINSTTASAGVEGIYKYRFSRQISLTGRVGGGAAVTHYAFQYRTTSGPEISSANFFVSAGVSLQYFLMKKVFLEAGTDWMHLFMVGFSQGGLTPFLLAGVQF